MRQPSTMSAPHNFAQVPSAKIQRASFDRSSGYKTSLDAGWLVPMFVDEVLPGDTFSLSMTGFARLSTPFKPVMDNMYYNTFFFFVPNRLLWDNWERFNGAQDNPGDSTDFIIPQIVANAQNGFQAGTLADYFALPLGVPSLSVCAFYHRAYNLIWNTWFRDENLQDAAPFDKGDGPDAPADYITRRRGKRHDYFTGSLPWPQKGDPVTIPLGQYAPVISDKGILGGSGQPGFQNQSGGFISELGMLNVAAPNATWTAGTPPTNENAAWQYPALVANLTDASAATINQLRQAFQIQKLLERDARGGTRYTEIVRAHFNVVSPDARLQRPEYLGGGQSPVLFSQVPQTAPGVTAEVTPQGNLAAYATSSMHGHGFTKSFTEHGVIVGLVSVRADLNYQQGLNRMWSRKSRFDYFWPALALIGEQAVYSKEIFCDGSAGDDSVWGYQERYAEYRYKPSVITGELRSSYPESLDIWHLAQDFATRPYLDDAFIQDNPPVARIVAVPSEPAFITDFWFQLRCARPMPVFGVPGLIDHF